MWLGAWILHVIASLSIIDGFTSGYSIQRSPYDFISELMETASPDSLIVYISPTDQTDTFFDEQEQQNAPSQSIEEEHLNFDHKTAKFESSNSVYNALINNFRVPLRDGDSRNPEIQKEKELMISNALRSRCEAIIRCEEKCAKPETKNENSTCSGIDSKFCEEDSVMATPKSNCPERCKAIFDHLINCPQLVTSKNKKEQKKKKGKKKKVCGLSTKKSLPASWKMEHTTESILNTTTESGTETTITATSLLPFTRVTGLKAVKKFKKYCFVI